MPGPSRKPPRDDPEAAFAAGLRLLARREHSRAEIARKLDQRGFPSSVSGPVTERLLAEGYLSDTRFAASLARHRAGQGYGELRIRAELRQHEIDPGAVADAIAGLDTDWVELARLQLRRHFGAEGGAAAARERMRRHLAQRGFPSSVLREALQSGPESGQNPG